MSAVSETARLLEAETEKIIVGKRRQIDLILTAILSGGHVLLNDLPGSGKTTLVKTLSLALGCEFRRLQFTPDLMPADVTGMTVFNQQTGAFELRKGPVHTNVLLADEINRAIPRTQSALLEAMEEGQTTIDGTTLPLPQPFIVLATQNPVERESTFPLPAAQLDRFFLCLSMGYPTEEEELAILQRLGDGIPFDTVQAVADPQKITALRGEAAQVQLGENCSRYIVSLVNATRTCPELLQGGSPRASRCLYQGAKAYAAMQGRDYVLPEDIRTLWLPVMAHRVTLTPEAQYRRLTAEGILQGLLDAAPVPPQQKELF